MSGVTGHNEQIATLKDGQCLTYYAFNFIV